MEELSGRFDALVDEFYRAWFRYHPEIAVDTGIPGYADGLTPFGDDDIGALAALNEKLLAGLDEIDIDQLDPDRATDYLLLRGQALIEHHELQERDWRRRDPARFLPVNAIYQLTVRNVENRESAFVSRLSDIPAYLRAARGQLGDMPELIPPIWLESAVAEATEGAAWLRGLDSIPGIPAKRINGVLHPQIEAAATALEEYAQYLEHDLSRLAQGEFACGRRHFDRLLQHRHFLDTDAVGLHGFGKELFDKTRAELQSLVEQHWPGNSIADVNLTIGKRHPEAACLLQTYEQHMQEAREFLLHSGLVSVPETEQLDIVPTPEFLRHQIPFAAYVDPAPNDPEQRGLYYVTASDDPEMLREHHVSGIRHTCVHEAWPGHHLQFVTANLSSVSRSWPRLVNASATMYEGWALYCEQLMAEQGHLAGPEHEFVLLRDRLWRALRVMLDVELQCEGLDVDAAVETMVRLLGFPEGQAHADVTWYTRSPTVPMGYATGWALVNEMRTQIKPSGTTGLRQFHDRLLSAGSAALSLGARRNFGVPFWTRIEQAVFH